MESSAFWWPNKIRDQPLTICFGNSSPGNVLFGSRLKGYISRPFFQNSTGVKGNNKNKKIATKSIAQLPPEDTVNFQQFILEGNDLKEVFRQARKPFASLKFNMNAPKSHR